METEVFFDPDKINEIEKWQEVKDYEIRIQRVNKKEAESTKAEKLVKEKTVSGKLIAYYLARVQQLYERYGIPLDKMRFRETDDDERAFYAKEGWDFEIKTSTGWVEVGPINYRTNYDLKRHMEVSGKDLHYQDPDGKRFIPHICEISLGVDRTFLVALETAYRKKEDRIWLELPPAIAPMHTGVFPLLKNKPELVKKAKKVYEKLKKCYEVFYDQAGSVGKRYARMDEVGVPWCITIDFESLEKDDVTIRDRDSTKQKRIKTSELQSVLYKLITGEMVIK
jgi:glycyl-tRNA synthetase